MSQTLPTQIAYLPSGYAANGLSGPQLILGGNATGAWDGIGLGSRGRADHIKSLLVNISDVRVGINPTVPGVINISASDLISIIYADGSNAPDQLNFRLTEVAICEEDDAGNTSEKRMVVLASQTYAKPDGPA